MSTNVKNNIRANTNNRIYYAIFHAIRAILAFDKIDFKKHSAVSTDNKPIVCYIDLEYVDAFLEAAKRPGVNLDKNQISHIERTLMFGRTINFLTDWGIYLLAAIITAGYLIKDYLPD